MDKHGIHPTDEKIAAIRDAPRPTNVKELKAYLGLLELLWFVSAEFEHCIASFTSPVEKGRAVDVDR